MSGLLHTMLGLLLVSIFVALVSKRLRLPYTVGLAAALVFGALISATDPVTVIATFRQTKVQGRLRVLVESESLLNDGVAAVLFAVALA